MLLYVDTENQPDTFIVTYCYTYMLCVVQLGDPEKWARLYI